ncbi:MAG: hypothetical protein CME43_06470 [Haliea sp.]|uniref:DUF883 C-terminal domain-containing protein n=1 Tax=Haliea sp. TaxID=1932666 RepID=UPI000C54C210|nr:DUF883 C-terminal domain-containing protein [Haliea sp.]MBM69106.1 hypothetical protein [Haliea sp.]
MAESTDQKPSQQEIDSGKEAALAAYQNLLEAQEHFRQAARSAGMDLKEDAMQQLLKGKHKADELEREMERYVHEKPLATIGIAFFAGLVVSRLLSRS